MDEYLKRRFTYLAKAFSIVQIIVLSMFAFILYKQHALVGLWSFLFSVPLLVGAFLFGIKRGNDKLRQLSDTEFILTADSIVQKNLNQVERDFKFSEIAVVNKTKFGTNIVKGGWLTRIDYYRPKRIPYQFGDPKLIFVPSITTNYSELIDTIKQAIRLKY